MQIFIGAVVFLGVVVIALIIAALAVGAIRSRKR
jgi:hypothetical protein